MKDWFANLEAREQAFVAGGAAIVVVALIYGFLWLPLDKQHREMVAALAKGDEVVTNGGLLGKITELDDSFVTLEVAENVKIKLQRQAVASVMPKGTLKSV